MIPGICMFARANEPIDECVYHAKVGTAQKSGCSAHLLFRINLSTGAKALSRLRSSLQLQPDRDFFIISDNLCLRGCDQAFGLNSMYKYTISHVEYISQFVFPHYSSPDPSQTLSWLLCDMRFHNAKIVLSNPYGIANGS